MTDEKQPDDLTIKIDGTEYPFPSFDTLTFKEARTIKRQYGIVIGQFFTALEQGDPDALLAIAYVAKRRDNPSFRPEDLEDLTLDLVELVTPPAPEEDMSSPLAGPLSANDEQSSKETMSVGGGSSAS